MVSSRQFSISSFHRDAWVEIDLSALESNVAKIRSWLAYTGSEQGVDLHRDIKGSGADKPPRSKQHTKVANVSKGQNNRERKAPLLMGVVKSDAYGHGAPQVAELLTALGVEWLGVASIDEGVQIRDHGVKTPVLVLGPAPFWTVESAIVQELDMTVTSMSQVIDIEKVCRRRKRQARLHLKIDSGMHRLGVAPESAGEIMDYISTSSELTLAGVFSHLANAADEEKTRMQTNCFDRTTAALGLDKRSADILVHMASSEAARRFPWTHYDMVRTGLYLYGLEPRLPAQDLEPVMSLRARISHIGTVEPGEKVGYNWTWQAKRRSRLASIPIGYADGVERRLSNNINALLAGSLIKQVGLISMDQMIFDITDLPEAQEGDVITLIGSEQPGSGQRAERLYLADWAQKLDTITYELACRLRARLPKVFTRKRRASASENGLPALSGPPSAASAEISPESEAGLD